MEEVTLGVGRARPQYSHTPVVHFVAPRMPTLLVATHSSTSVVNKSQHGFMVGATHTLAECGRVDIPLAGWSKMRAHAPRLIHGTRSSRRLGSVGEVTRGHPRIPFSKHPLCTLTVEQHTPCARTRLTLATTTPKKADRRRTQVLHLFFYHTLSPRKFGTHNDICMHACR